MAATRRCVRNGPQAGAKADGIGVLPASYEGELPGAGNVIVWHVDLLPEGCCRLRTTHVGQPEPNRLDDIGRWTRDELGRIVLRGGRKAPVFPLPVEGRAAYVSSTSRASLSSPATTTDGCGFPSPSSSSRG